MICQKGVLFESPCFVTSFIKQYIPVNFKISVLKPEKQDEETFNFTRKFTVINPSFTRKGGGDWNRPPKDFSPITFERNKLETPNFA